jgi:hypothetical protein
MDKMTVSQLQSEAKTRGMKGYSKLKKQELIALLSGDISPKVNTTGHQVSKKMREQLWDIHCGSKERKSHCWSCLAAIDILNFDAGHIISRSAGGATTLENLRPICRTCNLSCGVRNLEEFKETVTPQLNYKKIFMKDSSALKLLEYKAITYYTIEDVAFILERDFPMNLHKLGRLGYKTVDSAKLAQLFKTCFIQTGELTHTHSQTIGRVQNMNNYISRQAIEVESIKKYYADNVRQIVDRSNIY